jgi:hypothetical protein
MIMLCSNLSHNFEVYDGYKVLGWDKTVHVLRRTLFGLLYQTRMIEIMIVEQSV